MRTMDFNSALEISKDEIKSLYIHIITEAGPHIWGKNVDTNTEE